MKALVYHGVGDISWEDHPDPTILKPTDAVVQMSTTTICGTDLHIVKGDMPEVESGRILGHEGVGTIVEVGNSVTNFKPGDKVIVSCVSACGRCSYCKRGIYSHCLDPEGAPGLGWIMGYMIDGTQAEYVRVPFADTSLYKLPDGVKEEEGMLLSDILPTAHEIGAKYGHVKPGDVVAVVGAGPVGLSAMLTSRLYGPSKVIAIDLDENRVNAAKQFGATDGVISSHPDWDKEVMALTDGLGVDVAIEAVGAPSTLNMCFEIIRAGGNVANVGVHGKPVEILMNRMWIKNINLSMGLVNTDTLETLLKMVAAHQLDATPFVTHRFTMDQVLEAYDVFGNAKDSGALKVAITAN